MRVLKSGIAKGVVVKVKSGSTYIGRLVMVDSTMNLILSECKEVSWSGGDPEPVADYGTVLIRGSQVVYVAVNYELES